MPAPDSTFTLTQSQTAVTVALEPVQNILNSMMILNKVNHLSGYSQWIMETAVALTSQQAHNNLLVLEGLHYAVSPEQSWPTFPAYLDHLALQDPVELRDLVINAYATLPCQTEQEPLALTHPTDMLATLGTFLDYLQSRFTAEKVNIAIETEAYALLKNPPAMQGLIVSHLREMWLDYFAAEWERITPMLQESVNAFQQLDLGTLSPTEAAKQVIGQELPEWWQKMLEKFELEKIIFVPSAHIGPYFRAYTGERVMRLLFGARLPKGVTILSPDLSRSELLVRLSALADDTRLRILHLLNQRDELCSKDIMTELNLSQSAASRHLQQLSATGYLEERWREGAKCYSLSGDRIKSTFSAAEQFLLG
jgi:DNA-binding transcriptional ArsR family regulator